VVPLYRTAKTPAMQLLFPLFVSYVLKRSHYIVLSETITALSEAYSTADKSLLLKKIVL